MKIKIVNYGFGDAILICNVLNYMYPCEKFEFTISSDIHKFKPEEIGKKNLKRIFEIIIGQHNITWEEDESSQPFFISHEYIINLISNGLIEIDKNLYSQHNSKIEEEFIVLSCKVRYFDKEKYLSIRDKFFDSLNNQKYKIVLIGESFIDYSNGEYHIIGENKVYSIYQDVMKYVDIKKIIDLTFNGTSHNNVDDFLRDMNLIYRSEKTLQIGFGGIFCGGIFLENFISLTDNVTIWNTLSDRVFTDENKFLNCI